MPMLPVNLDSWYTPGELSSNRPSDAELLDRIADSARQAEPVYTADAAGNRTLSYPVTLDAAVLLWIIDRAQRNL